MNIEKRFLAGTAFAAWLLAAPAFAQSGGLSGTGALVRQDFSDCGNTNVSASDPARVGGSVTITQSPAGATTSLVQITRGTPNTAYDFYWKCQRGLGSVRTDGSGAGSASFNFQTSTGTPLTFDMYPAGAPAGNKFQSVRITPVAVSVVRKSITQLTPQEVASLRRGFAQMIAWNGAAAGSANFKRSLLYWANLHGYFGAGCAPVSQLNAQGMSGLSPAAKTTSDEQATWCTCEHGTIQFLTWHRMFLYYFEQVLQQAAGDPNLRLPFWDYETDATLPAAYRDPTYVDGSGRTVPNPLFITNRQPQLNTGSAGLSSSVVSTAAAMRQVSYAPFNNSIQGTPHGAVHCAVGVDSCPTGYMGSVPAAGNDPIFYSHHANIDRLYECWLRVNQAARLPVDPAQLAAQFSYIDGSGALVTRTVRDMLTTQQLGYAYAAGGGCPAPTAPASLAAVAATVATPEPRVFSVAGPTALQRGATVVPLAIAPAARGAMLAAPRALGGPPPRSMLVISGLIFDAAPGVLYEVYLQDAAGKRVLVGVIDFFTQTSPHDMAGMAAPAAPADIVLDATDAVRTLGGGASLVIEPTTGLTNSTLSQAADKISPKANVRFGAARIEVR